jgi:hypothetical protein
VRQFTAPAFSPLLSHTRPLVRFQGVAATHLVGAWQERWTSQKGGTCVWARPLGLHEGLGG